MRTRRNDDREHGVSKKKIFYKLMENAKRHLEQTLPGEIDRIEWEFYRRFNKSFIEHLFNKPEETIQVLLDYEGADMFNEAEKTKYILFLTLKSFFLNNRKYFELAYKYLKQKDWSSFKKIVDDFIRSLI